MLSDDRAADYLVKLKVTDAADYGRLHKDALSRLPGVARLQYELRHPDRRGGGPAALSAGADADLRGAPP